MQNRGLKVLLLVVGLWLISCVLLVTNCSAQTTESLTITTYYPSPYGVYNEVQLYPHSTPVTTCNATTRGTIYYDSDDDQIYACNGTGWVGSSGGYWALSGTDIYNTNTGNVGIGTTNPTSLLHISKIFDYSIPMLTLHNRIEAGGTVNLIEFRHASDGRTQAFIKDEIGSGWATNLHFGTAPGINNAVTRMTINSNGNVGIGTTGPGSKLAVNGGDIRVTGGSFIDDGTILNVPDYVFEPGYNLKPLSEVERFVLEYKHLNGLPAMGDIESWAKLSLQDRDMKLLEKIEELTLYIIELERKIAKLEAGKGL